MTKSSEITSSVGVHEQVRSASEVDHAEQSRTTGCASDFLRSARRLLIVMPSWVGDTVMATPLLHAIRRCVDSMSRPTEVVGYMRPGLDELLAGSDFLDETHTGEPSGVTGPIREGARLSSLKCDAAILLPNSGRLALTAFFAGIDRRLGYARDARSLLLTDPVPCPFRGGWKAPISTVTYYLRLADAIDAPTPDDQLRLTCTDEQRNAAAALLDRLGIGGAERLVVLNPGANRLDKRWPAERFAAIADHLIERHDVRVLVSGAPRERSLIESVCAAAQHDLVNMTSQTYGLGVLKALLERTTLLLTNDTGPRHIAAGIGGGSATGPAIVTIFGPTDPRYARINYPREIELSTGGSPIDGISTEQVTRACDELIG